MKSFQNIVSNALSLKLAPISIRELFYLNECPGDVYNLRHGCYQVVLNQYSYLGPEIIKDLTLKEDLRLFVSYEHKPNFIRAQQHNLRQSVRSLSVDDPFSKALKALLFLSINMEYLYQYPTEHETLELQYQSIKNLAVFLYNRAELHEKLYQEYLKQHHHYIFIQPLISSLFLMGIMKQIKPYNGKDIIALFVTSYFKDIGMSLIPSEKYNQELLSEFDKKIFERHPEYSINLLKGRIPLGRNYLRIIENHHHCSFLQNRFQNFLELEVEYSNDETTHTPKTLTLETMLIGICDIIAAMITTRPYRKQQTLYQALELVKTLISTNYQDEFKIIVKYFNTFFKNS